MGVYGRVPKAVPVAAILKSRGEALRSEIKSALNLSALEWARVLTRCHCVPRPPRFRDLRDRREFGSLQVPLCQISQ
jgi:hypothetical protein